MNPDKVRDSKLRTPLLVACASGEAAVVKVLLRYGADANNPVGDIVGNKPLDLAVVSNSVESVLALLEAGAQVVPPATPADDGVPVPIQQRLRKRSPLDLAKSRLAMMAQAGVGGDAFTNQVSQVRAAEACVFHPAQPLNRSSGSCNTLWIQMLRTQHVANWTN